MPAPRLAALALCGLALAACGGGDDTAATSGETSPLPTAEAETTAGTGAKAAEPGPRVSIGGTPIGPGAEGMRVRVLQRALAELGFRPGRPDGVYGDRTRRAVVAFQRRHDLRADGVVGTRTARAINRELREAASS